MDISMSWLFPPEHPFGAFSLVPPLVTILLAILTRRILPALLAGVFVGALILANGNPLLACAEACERHLWTSLADSDHLRVFVFTLLMGAMIGVMRYGGGMEALVDRLSPLAQNRRRGQLSIWGLGLIVFFDDYANCLLLGNTMRPLTDRLGISREKLAYIVDSTAAPVSGLALVSTWIAGEIGFIQAGFESLQLAHPTDGFAVFVATIPYRFYVLFALLLVPLVAWTNRDLGEMVEAERRAQHAATQPLRGPAPAIPESGRKTSAGDALVPVLVVLVVSVGLIFWTGYQKLASEVQTSNSIAAADLAAATQNPTAGPRPISLFTAFGQGNSYLSLVYGSLAGWLTACLFAIIRRLGPTTELQAASLQGALQVLPALSILWLAWALSGQTKADYLATGAYLGQLLQETLDVRWLPTAVFIVASLVAFCTGTSWGTMGILLPLVVPVGWQMLGADAATSPTGEPILIATIGGVLAGAIFGDHCSPISDTTVMSSQSSGCDHMAHVRTQMPYAMLAGLIAILCGTLPVGFGVSPYPLLGIGSLVMLGSLYWLGRSAESSPAPLQTTKSPPQDDDFGESV